MASIFDWSTTAASNSSADSAINWAEGQSPGSVNDSARQMMGRVAEFRSDLGGALSAGGTANGLTVTANSAFTTLADGRLISFRATASNSGAATLNVNGIGAKAIRKMTAAGEAALGAGDIQNTGIYVAQYSAALNGAAGGWLLVNPTVSAIVATTGTFSGAITANTVTAASNFITTAGAFVATGTTFYAYCNAGANLPIQATATTTLITGALIVTSSISSAGVITANEFFASSTTGVVLAPASAGTISLRPQGPFSATNQTTISSGGAMTINGTLTVTG